MYQYPSRTAAEAFRRRNERIERATRLVVLWHRWMDRADSAPNWMTRRAMRDQAFRIERMYPDVFYGLD